ncbi:MAG: hypothetical protein HQM07_08030 [Zetaproteobacteria bacterium]|nr:hypothetical protein [Zetaproteobacteria bacterium]
MSDDKSVNRCECINKTFAQIKAAASTLDEAQSKLCAGVECGGCLPYLEISFKTGENAFAVDDPRIEQR